MEQYKCEIQEDCHVAQDLSHAPKNADSICDCVSKLDVTSILFSSLLALK